MTKKPPSDEAKLLALGRDIQNILDMGYTSKRKALGFSLLKGIATGAGAFIGGTLVIAFVLWILSLFDQAPFVGGIVESAKRALESN